MDLILLGGFSRKFNTQQSTLAEKSSLAYSVVLVITMRIFSRYTLVFSENKLCCVLMICLAILDNSRRNYLFNRSQNFLHIEYGFRSKQSKPTFRPSSAVTTKQ